MLIKLITITYGVSGFIMLVSYLPQIRKSILHKGAGVSVSAWLGWCFTSASALFYAMFVVHDLLFSVLSLGHLIACSVITIIGVINKQHYRSQELSQS